MSGRAINWYLQRVTGAALLVLLIMHFWVEHFTAEVRTPAGLTFDQFVATLRSGHNPLDPPGTILQVMPWPVLGKKTDADLRAIYEYLSAIPSLPDNADRGPEP